MTWSFDVFFDLRLNKRLSKESWGSWFETPSRSLWRHCDATEMSFGPDPYCNQMVLQNSAHSTIALSSRHVHFDWTGWNHEMLFSHWICFPREISTGQGPHEPISQKVYELIIKVLQIILHSKFRFIWSIQVKILHISRQLCCWCVCKIVIWSDNYFVCYGSIDIYKIWIMSS